MTRSRTRRAGYVLAALLPLLALGGCVSGFDQATSLAVTHARDQVSIVTNGLRERLRATDPVKTTGEFARGAALDVVRSFDGMSQDEIDSQAFGVGSNSGSTILIDVAGRGRPSGTFTLVSLGSGEAGGFDHSQVAVYFCWTIEVNVADGAVDGERPIDCPDSLSTFVGQWDEIPG